MMKHTLAAQGAGIIVAAALLFGCSSTSGVTGALSSMGSAASSAGMGGAAAVLNAGSAISKAAEDITPEQSYYIGRAVAATILTNYNVYEDAAVEAYLNEICGIITLNSDTPEMYNGYHVKILDSTEVNAFSTSGGHILVTRGLLGCAQSEDALAAVIAHEIAHIQLEHSLKSIKTSRFTAAATATANAAVSVAGSAELASALDDMVGDVVTDMVNNGYSKDQEFAADTLALTLMADAGYNPEAMDDMLNVMKELQHGSSSGFYKTHPSPEKRITNVNKSLKKVTKPEDTTAARTARFSSTMN